MKMSHISFFYWWKTKSRLWFLWPAADLLTWTHLTPFGYPSSFFFVHVVLWTFPFPNFSISQIYRGLPFFRVHPPFFLKKISFSPVFFLFVCSLKVNLSFIYFAAPFSHLSRFPILFGCFLFIFLLKHFPYCCNFSFVTLSLTGWPIFSFINCWTQKFSGVSKIFVLIFFRNWMHQ